MQNKKIYSIITACVVQVCLGCSPEQERAIYNFGYSDNASTNSAPKPQAPPNFATKAGNFAKACVAGVVTTACNGVIYLNEKIRATNAAIEATNNRINEQRFAEVQARNNLNAVRIRADTISAKELALLRHESNAAQQALNASTSRAASLAKEAAALNKELAAMNSAAATATRTGTATTASSRTAAAVNGVQNTGTLSRVGGAVSKVVTPIAIVGTGYEVVRAGDNALTKAVFAAGRGGDEYPDFLAELRAKGMQITVHEGVRVGWGSDNCEYGWDPTLETVKAKIRTTQTVCPPHTRETFLDAAYKQHLNDRASFPAPLAPIQNTRTQRQPQLQDLYPTGVPRSSQNEPFP